MCGIAGYIGKKIISDKNISHCIKTMSSRGPDANSYKRFVLGNTHYCLLHSRLSIIDLDLRSNQPFSFENLCLIFNGEIYNYIELREELIKNGYFFQTNSDTEVLIKAFHFWGNTIYNRLEGMWAFAIYNKNTGELILSRDRFAEKPLFYFEDKDGIYFASEVKNIFALLGKKLEINYNQINRYLVNGYKSLYKKKETFFKDLKELDFASYVIINSNILKKEVSYWKLRSNINSRMNYSNAVEQVRELLINSVKLRLRSDVPLAFCLSGGGDSSSLVSIAAKELNYNVSTFSIIDNDERYNEYENISTTVKDIGCDHKLVYLDSKQDMMSELKNLIAYRNSPVATISYLIHSFLSQQISNKGYKVSISGTAADELFTGYYDHFNLQLYVLFGALVYKKKLSEWNKHIKPLVRNPYLQDPELYLKDSFSRNHIFLNNTEFEKFLVNDFHEDFKENEYSKNLLHNRMMNELFHEITRVILYEDDSNSMMNSIENRSPYLDKNLAEFAYTIPNELLIDKGYGKKILRDAMKGILNEKVRLDRHKKGFNASINSIFDFKNKETKEEFLDDGEVFKYVKKIKIEELISKKYFSNSESKFLFSFINAKHFINENR